MIPIIDIFDGTNNSQHYEVLREAIQHLAKYKSGIEVRNYQKSEEFLNSLKRKNMSSGDKVDLIALINSAFDYEPFKENSQKIILINNIGVANGMIHSGMAGGYTVDKYGQGTHKETIALSTALFRQNPRWGLNEFYAVCCHELGHMYGATRNRTDYLIPNDPDNHCLDGRCAMHEPAFNEGTRSRRANKTPMYCPVCREGIIRY